MVLRVLVGPVARVLLIVLAAGLLGASLVRFAPAFGVSETELDPRLSRDYAHAHTPHENILVFYVRYLRGAVTGDFGVSPSFERPIGELLKERLPVSLRSLAI